MSGWWTFNKYFLSHLVNDCVSRDTPFPAIGVTGWKRKLCLLTGAFVNEGVRPPAGSSRGSELVGPLRKVVRFKTAVMESGNGVDEKPWRSLLSLELINL